MPSIYWTEERVTELTKLRNQGYSCSQIADILKGCTRNAVIGKLSRLGIAISPKRLESDPFRRERKPPRTPRPKKPIREKLPNPVEQHVVFRIIGGGNGALRLIETIESKQRAPRCVDVTPRNIPLSELETKDCRYIAGEDHLYCALPQKEGSSYCPAHHALVYIKPLPPKQTYFREAA